MGVPVTGAKPPCVIVLIVVAIAALGFACRPGYGVAPRIFFALALAFALASLGLPAPAAAVAAALLLVVLGTITLLVDRKRIRIPR